MTDEEANKIIDEAILLQDVFKQLADIKDLLIEIRVQLIRLQQPVPYTIPNPPLYGLPTIYPKNDQWKNIEPMPYLGDPPSTGPHWQV